jgi:hypothetical protein
MGPLVAKGSWLFVVSLLGISLWDAKEVWPFAGYGGCVIHVQLSFTALFRVVILIDYERTGDYYRQDTVFSLLAWTNMARGLIVYCMDKSPDAILVWY